MQAEGERERKALALMGMAENFGKRFSKELLRMWLTLLEPYEAELVEKAVMRILLEYEYKTLPPYAVLKKALDNAEGSASLEVQALGEWNRLLENIRSRGIYYGPPDNMDPVTAYVLRGMGGWGAACLWDVSSLGFKEKDFISRWQEVAVNREFLGVPAKEALPQGMSSVREALDPCLAALAAGERDE